MNDLDPAWLRSFDAIARTGSITRAAMLVHRTQSAVSMQLQQLENAVGVRLVERSTRALALTEQGERLLPHARGLIDAQREAHAAVVPQPTPTVWRIGISEYFLPGRLGELLDVLQGSAPHVRFELLWSGSMALKHLWDAEQVDLVVVLGDFAGLGARLLRREPLVWVVAPGHSPSPGASAPLVLLGPDCPVREKALQALARSGRPHHLRLGCSGSQAAVAAIRAGWGVGCLNTTAVPSDLQVLTKTASGFWPPLGHASFSLLARPALTKTAAALRRWAAG